MSFSKATIPDFLDYVLSILEMVIVLAIALLTGYAVFCFVFGTHEEARFIVLMQVISENWKASLVLLIPLFYRPVRTFLEELEQVGSIRRRNVRPTAKQQEDNPTPETL